MPQPHLPTHGPLPRPEEDVDEEEESSSDDDQTNLSHLIAQVVVQLQYTVDTKKGKSTMLKPKNAKKKLETKTKDFPFTFEATQANYLAFLSAILEKH